MENFIMQIKVFKTIPAAEEYQEIHPSSVGYINSIKINISLMKNSDLCHLHSKIFHLLDVIKQEIADTSKANLNSDQTDTHLVDFNCKSVSSDF